MKAPTLSHATRIARVEVRRSVRAVRSSTTRTAAFAVALLFWVALPTVGGGFVAYRLGQSLPEVPSAFPVLDLVRGGTAVGWVGIAALAAARSAGGKSELDAPTGPIHRFLRAARAYAEGDATAYVVALRTDGDRVAVYRKRTLLVYDEDGSLRREDSLIPGGVEL